MKKIVVTACLTMILVITMSSFGYANNHIYGNNNPFKDSKEKLYQYTIQSFLSPYIDKAIDDYYGQGFQQDPWDNKILNIEGAENLSYFILKIEVQPYFGPHRWVGVDHITIRVTVNGDVKVEKFEHIKTLEIPQKPTRS